MPTECSECLLNAQNALNAQNESSLRAVRSERYRARVPNALRSIDRTTRVRYAMSTERSKRAE